MVPKGHSVDSPSRDTKNLRDNKLRLQDVVFDNSRSLPQSMQTSTDVPWWNLERLKNFPTRQSGTQTKNETLVKNRVLNKLHTSLTLTLCPNINCQIRNRVERDECRISVTRLGSTVKFTDGPLEKSI